MGIIARQTIKGSVYSYLGAFIGFVNVGVLMPKLFTTDQVGLANLLVSLSAILGYLGSLGFVNVTIRLFPYFRNKEKNHNGFLFMLISMGTLGFLICASLYYLYKDSLIEQNIEKSALFAEYVYLLLPMVFITIFYYLIDTYNRVLFNASFGMFVKEFLLRVINLAGIALFYFDIFTFHDFIFFYVIAYSVPLLLISILLMFKKDFSIKPLGFCFKKGFYKQIISVAAFGLIAGFSGIGLLHIDKYIVNSMCDLSSTGIYATAFFFGTIIFLPGRSLIRISTTMISEALKNNDVDTIKSISRKSTSNMILIGVFLFILLWGNINNIMTFLPDEYQDGKFVVLFIAISHLFQMIAGVSGEIILYSKYYKQFALSMILIIGIMVGLDLLIIPYYGIVGAAIAYAISLFVFTIIRIQFVKARYGFYPFEIKQVWIVVIALIILFVSMLIPNIYNLYIDAIIRTAIICLGFAVPIISLNLAPEMNNLVLKYIKAIRGK